MGEFADMSMLDSLTMDESFIDEYDADLDPYWIAKRTPRSKTCKTCGQNNLWWEWDEAGWYLATASGERHACQLNFTRV